MREVGFKEILETVSEGIPKYRRVIFKALIAGMIIGESSKCISSIYRMFSFIMFSIGISRRRFYDFLESGKISFSQVWKILFKMFEGALLVGGRLIVLLDDTTFGKSGKKIEGCEIHYDHASKINSSKYIHGQCRVMLGVLVKIHDRWACLPIKNALYRSKKSIDKTLFRTKIQLGGNLIREFMEEFSNSVLIVADSWFGNKSMAKEIGLNICERVHILTRLRIDCLLYELQVQQNKGRGRKRIYGKKLPKLTELAKALERKSDKFFVYGKERNVEYSEFTAMHKGFMRQVKVVLVYTRNNHIFPILSTDLNLSVKEMIEYYSARWKIESGFKELKHELGAIDNQARRINSVENHFSLCMIAQTTVWLYALKQETAPPRKYASSKTTRYSFGDVRRMIVSEYYEKGIFNGTCSKTIKSIENIFMLLLLSRSA